MLRLSATTLVDNHKLIRVTCRVWWWWVELFGHGGLFSSLDLAAAARKQLTGAWRSNLLPVSTVVLTPAEVQLACKVSSRNSQPLLSYAS